MRSMYIATEAMGAAIILILLYANLFEIKHVTRKKRLFSYLLILNELVVVADVVSWIRFDWKTYPLIFGFLISITYIVPFFIQIIFAEYIYEHLSENAKVSRVPFQIVTYPCILACIATVFLCVAGKMFTIEDGIWRASSMEPVYYLYYMASILIIAGVIIAHRKKLGTHDFLAALSFCCVPLFSIALSIAGLGINFAIIFMAIEMLIVYIMLQSEREKKLIYASNNDELTGILNRRAYEDTIANHPDVPPEPDFIYASIDINGLKQVNDTLGHAAGDELIFGAAYCLKRTFGSYGNIFRTGGDEFTALFFADEIHLKLILEDLRELTSHWQGKALDSISLSVGYAEKREFPDLTVKELSEIADQRMYAEKERHYSEKGLDRRGQSEAHKALCALYTKILKINVTDDSFSVINMNPEELAAQCGYHERISLWLEHFGRSGFVHPEDLPNYLAKTNIEFLRDYFRQGKASLTILYRRKYGDGFRQVMMELIPACDYRADHQTLFLYVKNIDG